MAHEGNHLCERMLAAASCCRFKWDFELQRSRSSLKRKPKACTTAFRADVSP